MAILQQFTSPNTKTIIEDKDVSSTVDMGTPVFTKIFEAGSSGFTSSDKSHLLSLLNLYTENIADDYNKSFVNGGILNTSINDMVEAYKNNGFVFFEVPDTNWAVSLNGYNFRIKIPLDSTYSGTTGFSATTLYTSFIQQPWSLERPSNNCAATKIDTLNSESYKWFADKGIGYEYKVGENPDANELFQNGFTLLYSDDFDFSGATSGNTSWSSLYSKLNKYSNGARMSNFFPNGTEPADRSIGVIFNNGFGFLWDTDVVSGFDWASGTGATSTSGVTFDSNLVAMEGSDIDQELKLVLNLNLGPEQFNTTTNPSYYEAVKDGSNCDVSFTTVGFHDESGNCLAIAKVENEAIIKSEGNYQIMNFEIPVGGSVDYNRYTYVTSATTGVFSCNVGSC
jgi:hypothetical protein